MLPGHGVPGASAGGCDVVSALQAAVERDSFDRPATLGGARRRRAPGARRRVLIFAAVFLLVPLIAGCGKQTPTMFSSASSSARDISTLTYTLFGILAAILIVVWVWLFLAIKRFRKRPESEASQVRGSRTGEIVWTVIPLVIVGVLFYLTLHTTGQILGQKSGAAVTVTGHQWWWEFSYPQGGFKTADELHLPVGVGTSANILSADVMHGFWIPQLGGKVDAIPGHVTKTTVTPTATGTYIGECSEFCGMEHHDMRFLVVVQSAQDYAAWYADQQTPAAPPSGASAQAGAKLIASLQCSSCHRIRGTSLQGATCPDLTHFGSRLSIAGDTLTNTAQNLRVWLKDPQAVKPGTIMPAIQLSDSQLDELVAYLEGLK